MTSRNDDTAPGESAEVPMTVRFTRDVKEALRLASFTHRISQNDLVREGTVMRLASLDDTLARALADCDPHHSALWDSLGETGKSRYRLMASKAVELLTGASEVAPRPETNLPRYPKRSR